MEEARNVMRWADRASSLLEDAITILELSAGPLPPAEQRALLMLATLDDLVRRISEAIFDQDWGACKDQVVDLCDAYAAEQAELVEFCESNPDLFDQVTHNFVAQCI